MRKTPQGGTATDYLLSGIEVAEAVTGASNTSYVFPGVISEISGPTRTVYHPDIVGSTRAITGDGQAVQGTCIYDAYGNAQPGFASGSTLAFAGQYGYESNAETGLQYLKARYYDPMVGRFISRDPIGYLGGLNVYGYVGGNPVAFIDPLGLTWILKDDKGPWVRLDRARSGKGQDHLHWGEGNKEWGSMNADGTPRHGHKHPNGQRNPNRKMMDAIGGDNRCKKYLSHFRGRKGGAVAVDSISASLQNDPVEFVDLVTDNFGKGAASAPRSPETPSLWNRFWGGVWKGVKWVAGCN